MDRCYGAARRRERRRERAKRRGGSQARRRERRRERAKRSEPRARSEPAKRRARARVGESEGRSPSEKNESEAVRPILTLEALEAAPDFGAAPGIRIKHQVALHHAARLRPIAAFLIGQGQV